MTEEDGVVKDNGPFAKTCHFLPEVGERLTPGNELVMEMETLTTLVMKSSCQRQNVVSTSRFRCGIQQSTDVVQVG
jgi:hypothetical protein